MALLRAKSKKEDEQFSNSRVNFSISTTRNAYSLLTMCGLAMGLTKSVIIKESLDNWFTKNVDDTLFKKLANRFINQWVSEKTLNTNLTFDDYVLKVETELKMKRIDMIYIEKIKKFILQEHSKRNEK